MPHTRGKPEQSKTARKKKKKNIHTVLTHAHMDRKMLHIDERFIEGSIIHGGMNKWYEIIKWFMETLTQLQSQQWGTVTHTHTHTHTLREHRLSLFNNLWACFLNSWKKGQIHPQNGSIVHDRLTSVTYIRVIEFLLSPNHIPTPLTSFKAVGQKAWSPVFFGFSR